MKQKITIILIVLIVLAFVSVLILSLTKNNYTLPVYTVTLDKDIEGQEMQIINADKFDKITIPETPVKPGYKFIEWRQDEVPYNFDSIIVKDITLTAIYEPVYTKVESLEFIEEITVAYGSTYELKPILLPEYATNKEVTYTTSNWNVATVENNILTAHRYGTCYITVTSNDSGIAKTTKVTVN